MRARAQVKFSSIAWTHDNKARAHLHPGPLLNTLAGACQLATGRACTLRALLILHMMGALISCLASECRLLPRGLMGEHVRRVSSTTGTKLRQRPRAGGAQRREPTRTSRCTGACPPSCADHQQVIITRCRNASHACEALYCSAGQGSHALCKGPVKASLARINLHQDPAMEAWVRDVWHSTLWLPGFVSCSIWLLHGLH